jgi:glutathione S-transferase
MRVIYNIADQYVMTPLYDLFDQIDPSKRQQAVVDEKLAELNKALEALSHFLDDGKYAVGGSPSLADCALVPVLFFATAIGPAFGLPDVFAKAPKVGAHYKALQADAPVQKLVAELTKGLADYMAGNG